MQDCVQIHGGIGVTFEHDLHLYLRRHTLDRALYGTPAEHRQRIAAIVERRGTRHERRAEIEAVEALPRAGPHLDPRQPQAARRGHAWSAASATTAPTRRSWPPSPTSATSSACSSTPAWPASASRPSTAARASPRPTSRRSTRSSPATSTRPGCQAPTFSPCAAVILDFGTEEQKRQHLPAILKGEEIWMQFLSEPSGGSDVAGALTTAVRDGDEWMLNGSKVWTTGAWWSDWGLVPGPDQLGRPEAPGPVGVHAAAPPGRHRGPPHRDAQRLEGVLPGVHDRRAGPRHRPARRGRRRLDGRHPVDVPRADAPQLAVRHHPGRAVDPRRRRPSPSSTSARAAGRLDDPVVRDLVGEARMLEVVGDAPAATGSARASPRARSPTSPPPSAGCSSARRPPVAPTHRLRDRRRRPARPGPTTTAPSPSAAPTS